MKNFLKVADGIDVIPLLAAIQMHPELWNQNTLRTEHELTPHKEVSDIWIRFNDLEPYKQTGDIATVVDEHESIWYPAASVLPVRGLIFDLMRRFEAERLGRVIITRLPPGKQIDPHEDGGEHAKYYKRFHLLLQSLPGALFHCEDETVNMRTGECWWFNNGLTHSVVNNSADDRITMIVDIKC